MSLSLPTRFGSAAAWTVAAISGLTIGIPAGMYAALSALSDDPTTTRHVLFLAALVAGIAADVMWMANTSISLLREYRRQS